MNRSFCIFSCLLVATVCGQTRGSRTFELTLPDDWQEASAVYVVFKDLEVPGNRAVVFRLFATGPAGDQSLGAVSVLGKAPDATGVQHLERLEANVTREFRRWATTAKPSSTVTIRVKPYAGLREAPDYAWQVKEVKLEASKESVAAFFP
jgi:hypothetical protein